MTLDHSSILNMPHPHSAPEAWLVSVDSLKAWSKCQKKFEYHVAQQYRWPTDPSNFDFGQNVHKLMDYQAKGHDCSVLLQHSDTRTQAAWDLLINHPTTRRENCLASEWGFTLPAPNYPLPSGINPNTWLIGRMDRLNHVEQTVQIIDWKTGTATPKNPIEDWQTRVYLYVAYETRAIFNLSHYTHHQFEFIYVGVKEREHDIHCVKVPYSKTMHEETRQRLSHTLAVIHQANHQQQYQLPNKCPDKWCPYREICGIQSVESDG